MKKVYSTYSAFCTSAKSRIFLTVVSIIVSISVKAQIVNVYENGKLTYSTTNSSTNTVRVVFGEIPDAKNLLPGKFSVSATKQVQFTKSNLYWDGSDFRFEANQTDYQTSWNENHVSHFYWTNLTDYQSGTASYMPYAESYSYSNQSTSDTFWCNEDNPITVEGTSGLYALTGGSSGEWYYLIKKRTNASSLCKWNVTVTNGRTEYTNCLIIAPDDFDGTLQSSYTLVEINALGLVCLPAAGKRQGSNFSSGGGTVYCWTATLYKSWNHASSIFFGANDYDVDSNNDRSNGFSIRLVCGY